MKLEPITPNGVNKIKKDIAQLNDELNVLREKRNIDYVTPLPEDTDYTFLLEEMTKIENNIQELKRALASSSIIDPSDFNTNTVKFGLTVTLVHVENENKKLVYTLVGPLEANISENKISVRCKVGGSLLGKELDDEIDIVGEGYYISDIENSYKWIL